MFTSDRLCRAYVPIVSQLFLSLYSSYIYIFHFVVFLWPFVFSSVRVSALVDDLPTVHRSEFAFCNRDITVQLWSSTRAHVSHRAHAAHRSGENSFTELSDAFRVVCRKRVCQHQFSYFVSRFRFPRGERSVPFDKEKGTSDATFRK